MYAVRALGSPPEILVGDAAVLRDAGMPVGSVWSRPSRGTLEFQSAVLCAAQPCVAAHALRGWLLTDFVHSTSAESALAVAGKAF